MFAVSVYYCTAPMFPHQIYLEFDLATYWDKISHMFCFWNSSLLSFVLQKFIISCFSFVEFNIHWNLKFPHLQQVVVGLPPEVWWPAGAPWNRQGEAGGHLLPLLHWRQPCGTPTNSQPVKGTTNEQPPIKVPNLLHSDMQWKMICQEKRVEGRLLVQHA